MQALERTDIISPRIYTKTLLDSLGQCMYCFTIDQELIDEHIIAFALGGILVLPKSSCRSCADITSSFEKVILNDLWKLHRSKYKYPTRRPKQRIKEVKLEKINAVTPFLTLPIAEYPAPAFMYKCEKAGILQGCDPKHNSALNWEIVGIVNHEEINLFHNKFGREVKFTFKNVYYEYAQMLAKIAYSYAVGMFGVGSFEPLVLDLIKTKNANPGYFVGGSLELQPPIPEGGHLLEVELLITGINSALLIINIRLMSSAHTPNYHVVVGKLPNEHAIQNFLNIAKNHKDFAQFTSM